MIRKIPDGRAEGPAAAEADDEDAAPRRRGKKGGAKRVSDEGDAASHPRDDATPASDGGTRPLPLRLEALLFASPRALSAGKLAKLLEADLEAVQTALEGLVAAWAARETALELVQISGGYRFMTKAAFKDDLSGLARKGRVEHLSPAALETLAVVAYRQPITRADLEAVRGVQSGPLLRVLLDRDLIRIAGRSPDPGHPLLYGTTKRFLDHFGLKSLKQLPDIKDLLDSP